MADKSYEPEDPFQPVAVQLATPGYDGMEAMARCFVEEYALLGWPPEKVFRLFTIPEFAGSHSVLLQRGPGFIMALIESVYGLPATLAEPISLTATTEGEGNASGL